MKKKLTHARPKAPDRSSLAHQAAKQPTDKAAKAPDDAPHNPPPAGHKQVASSNETEAALVPKKNESSPVNSFPIVGIGASAGGFEAFRSFLGSLTPDIGMAFVLVQHLDPTHESLLHQLLARIAPIPVMQAANGMRVEPNRVYVIPPNAEMTIRGGALYMITRPDGAARHTPIDTFLRALGQDRRDKAIGIILSGIGSDGTKGLQAIKAEGGITFTQDEESSKYSGMPMHAVAAGCVDLVLPPEKMAEELARIIRHSYLETGPQALGVELRHEENAGLRKIIRLVLSRTGVDFANYKQATIRRRIAKRMLVRRCETLAEYAKYVEEHPDEASTVLDDLLIHVTGFFRESQVFQHLVDTVFPRAVATLQSGEPVRIWVPGCSSGEEVYSIVMLLSEFLGDTFGQTRVQIFGTDARDKDIQKARTAIYSNSGVAQVSPERLRRFFVNVEGGYQISKDIRDVCMFARHDLTKDPPFSRMDIISCRNLLIYLAPALQKKVLNYFHYALKPAGFLILGQSENVSTAVGLFSLENRHANVYVKIAPPDHASQEFKAVEQVNVVPASPVAMLSAPTFDLRKEAERVILEHYAPPALVVDSNLQIVHFQGDTSSFLKPVPGQASLSVLRLVRSELIFEVRRAIQQSKMSGKVVRHESLPFKCNGELNLVDLEALPINGRLKNNTNFLVLFGNLRLAASKGRQSVAPARREEAKEIERLKRELTLTQDHLRALDDDHEAAAEELRAANEEAQSSNEELQSTNEELETAKEELQSSNEELTTLNEELQNRNRELGQTASDLNNLLSAIEIPVVILGNDRTIRRFTSTGAMLFNLIASDVGRPIGQIRPRVDIPDLDRLASDVIKTSLPQELEVRDQKGHWYALRIRPYQADSPQIGGVLIAIEDVNDLKQFSTAIVESMRTSLVVLDYRFRVISANPAFYRTFQIPQAEAEGRVLFEVSHGQWNISELRELIDRVVREKRIVEDFELAHEFPSIGRKVLLVDVHQLSATEKETGNILVVIEDLTERKSTEIDLALRKRELQELSARLLSAAEDEKKRMARELHDAFGQKLALLNLRIGEVETLLPAQPDLAIQKLHTCDEQIGVIAQEIHEFSRVLHPATLRELGLSVALRGECEAYVRRTGTAVNFSTDDISEGVPDDVGLCLYRVAQESLENIRKHAESNLVNVTVKRTNDEIQLLVEDFGRGFDIDSQRSKGGLGLIGMEERVRLVGGSVFLKTKAGDGTLIEVHVPLRRNAP